MVDIPAGTGQVCTFTNRFTHAGRDPDHQATLNADATTRFQIRPLADPGVEYEQIAETTADGPEVLAEGDDTSGDPARDLRHPGDDLRRPGAPTASGGWSASSATRSRSGASRAAWSSGSRTENPHVRADFTNELFDPEPPTPEPPDPEPPGPLRAAGPVPTLSAGGVAGETAENLAELRVTKVASPRRVTLGGIATYRVVVRNRGPAAARAVTLVEATRARPARHPQRPDEPWRLPRRAPRYCVARPPGARRARRHHRAGAPRRLGRLRNIVAVNTGTQQRTRRGKVARASVAVVPAQLPRFTG